CVAVGTRYGDQVPPRQTPIETFLGGLLSSLPAIRRSDPCFEGLSGTRKENREQDSRMSTQHSLKVFEEREVIGMRVAHRLDDQGDTMLGRLFESDHACGMNQIPKPWCIEVDHGPGEVHRGMVVKETSIREVNDRLADRAFFTSQCTMDEQKLHRSCVTPCVPE